MENKIQAKIGDEGSDNDTESEDEIPEDDDSPNVIRKSEVASPELRKNVANKKMGNLNERCKEKSF